MIRVTIQLSEYSDEIVHENVLKWQLLDEMLSVWTNENKQTYYPYCQLSFFTTEIV